MCSPRRENRADPRVTQRLASRALRRERDENVKFP
jgi:hypothetical protein